MKIFVLERIDTHDSPAFWVVDTDKFNMNDSVHVAYKQAIDQALLDSIKYGSIDYDNSYGDHWARQSLDACKVTLPDTVDDMIVLEVD